MKKTMIRVVTNSERSAFACERLWYFGYVEGLTGSVTPAPLRQGSLTHLCVEAVERSAYSVSAETIALEVIEPWLEGREHWANDLGTVEAYEALEVDRGLADTTAKIIAGYIEAWASWVDDWETIAIGPQVGRWILHGDGKPLLDRRRYSGRLVTRRWAYGGRVDRVVRHRRSGEVWQVETKTTAEKDLEAFCGRLHWDPQTRGYAWAAMNPAAELTDKRLMEPVRIRGVIYDVIRKAVPTIPPLLVKCGACGHSSSVHDGIGCSGSKKCECKTWVPGQLSTRADIDTTRDTYLSEIIKHGLDPDDDAYTDLLGSLPGWESFFHREFYDFSDAEIREFGSEVYWSSRRMIDAEKASYHPRQTRICQGYGSRIGCPGGFDPVCREDGAMTRSLYKIKSIRHAELDGDLCEPGLGSLRLAEAKYKLPILQPADRFGPGEPDESGPEITIDDEPSDAFDDVDPFE